MEEHRHLRAVVVALDEARGGKAIPHDCSSIGRSLLQQQGERLVLGLFVVTSCAPLDNVLK
jgi:hypothetical protein